MILNGKQLLELEEARDKFTIDFAKWLIKNYKKAPQFKTVKKYVLRKQNKVVADEFTIKKLLEVFKEEKIKPLLKQ